MKLTWTTWSAVTTLSSESQADVVWWKAPVGTQRTWGSSPSPTSGSLHSCQGLLL